jgi:hypothetical protein
LIENNGFHKRLMKYRLTASQRRANGCSSLRQRHARRWLAVKQCNRDRA